MKSDAMREWVLRLVGAMLVMSAAAATAAAQVPTGPVSGLPVPRFVSLKSDKVNVRAGPAREQDVAWVYSRAALPVEVTAEFENWRKIRDWEGAEGWVYHSMLSGKRTATVVPKTKDELVPLFEKANLEAPIVARLQPGVLGTLRACTGNWCQFSGKGFDGFVQQE